MTTPRGSRLSFDDSDMADDIASQLSSGAPSSIHSPTYSATSPTYSPYSPVSRSPEFVNSVRHALGLNQSPTRLLLEAEDEDLDRTPMKRSRLNYSDVLSVLVGPEEAEFVVHKDIICARSNYFATACSQRWEEGRTKVVPLPDVDSTTFQMYMDWMLKLKLVYDKKLPTPLIKLYLLGDFLDDVSLRNKAMSLLFSLKICPSESSINFIWDNTLHGSLLRNWVIDLVAWRQAHADFASCVALYPAEFVQQLAVKLHQQVSAPGSGRRSAKLQDYLEVVSGGE